MLVTKQKVLRRFWYSTMRVDELKEGPKPFTLLGEQIVLFLDGDGQARGARRPLLPSHRKALEGLGARNGNIVCGYHGWEYDRDGKLVDDPAIPR